MDATFRTPDGTPVPAVTADEMRAVDRVAVEETGPPLLAMMEHAGATLARVARKHHDGDGPVVVFAGTGNNGGGGLCAARHLANHDSSIEVVLAGDPADLDGAPATHHRLLDAMDVPVRTDAGELDDAFAVDAVLGYGLRGAPRGRAADLVAACGDADRVLSLDVPSGVDATTGEVPGAAVDPDWTLALALPKTGLEAVPGVLSLADLGIPRVVYERAGVDAGAGDVRPFAGRDRVRLTRD